MWGVDTNNVWVVGAGGVICKWNGTTWATQASGTTEELRGVWAADANNVWVIGGSSSSVILKWDRASSRNC